MISPNVEALKLTDNLKWDFQDLYQKSLQVFNYSGEETEEYRENCNRLTDRLHTIVEETNSMLKQTAKLPQTVNGVSFQIESK